MSVDLKVVAFYLNEYRKEGRRCKKTGKKMFGLSVLQLQAEAERRTGIYDEFAFYPTRQQLAVLEHERRSREHFNFHYSNSNRCSIRMGFVRDDLYSLINETHRNIAGGNTGK